MHARLVFILTATLGLRTTFFQYWRWRDVEVIKVPMRDGKQVPAGEVRQGDPSIKVGHRCYSIPCAVHQAKVFKLHTQPCWN